MRVLGYPFVLLSFIAISSRARAQIDHQFSVISDNDAYISINNDGYYTNGLKFSYQWRAHPAEKQKFNVIEIGQLIYNARFTGEIRVERLDRPITGYLYGAFHQKKFNVKDDLLQWGVSTGFIGKPALGQEFQEAVHRSLHIYKPQYWDMQLKGAWGVNGDIIWSPQLGDATKRSGVTAKPILSGTLGTIYTNAGVGTAVLFGKFKKNSKSVFWNNHDGETKEDKELFFFLYPEFFLKGYDATVQGGMFNKGEEKIGGKLNPMFFQAKAGIKYAGNKMSVGFTAFYENKQSKTQFSDQWYGRLELGFMW